MALAARILLLLSALAAVAAAATKSAPDSVAVVAGAKLYAQYCTACHGKSGRGDGLIAESLKPKPRDFRDPKQLKSKTDDDLVKVISKGGPALGLSPTMLGWGATLKEPQIRQLAAFVRSMIDSSGAARTTAKGE